MTPSPQNASQKTSTNLYSGLAEICHLFYKQYFPHKKIADRLDNVLAAHSCKTIIFIGGLIHVAKILQQKGYKISFVDYTQEMLDEAKQVLGRTPMFQSDMRSLSLDGQYDAVIAMGRGFTYMHSDTDALKTLDAFRRHLKPQGIVVMDNYETGKIDKGSYFNGSIRTKKRHSYIRRMSTIRQKRKKPALYIWDCVYERMYRGKRIRYTDTGHLLRSFTKKEVERLFNISKLKFISHYLNFEKKSFISVAQR